MSWQLIEDDAALAPVLAACRAADSVIVDTEFMRRNTFYPEVALLQLSVGDTAWLIDPLAIDDTSGLVALLTDGSVVKVLHSASEDLEVFQRWLGVLPQPLFDTQRAAALLDMGFGMGYGALVQAVCEVELEKGETRSNWLQRPLTESQCHYAAQDVIYLHEIWVTLAQRCREQGKYEWVLADGADAVANLASNGNDYYRRIKSAWKLDSRQLSALMAVCEWREGTARERNKPRSWIIDDKACLQLAQTAASTPSALADSVELPAPVMRRYADQLLALLASQRARPADELPARLPAPLVASQRELAKKLKLRVKDIAGDLGVAPEILLGNKDYEALLREDRETPLIEPQHWQGWRQQVVIQPLREYLAVQSS